MFRLVPEGYGWVTSDALVTNKISSGVLITAGEIPTAPTMTMLVLNVLRSVNNVNYFVMLLITIICSAFEN